MSAVLLVGSTGTIGSAVVATLAEAGHDLITADYQPTGSSLPIDITDSASIANLYRRTGPIDAVVCTVGQLDLAPLPELTRNHVANSITWKLLSQVDLVLQGLNHVRERGSFTLVSGIMSRIPWRGGASAAVTNGGIDGFVVSLAAELDRDRRINSVSPSIVQESIDALGGRNPLPGHRPVTANEVALAFLRSVEGIETGQTFTVGF
ncbi:MAG: short chain dehydrogenase [Propionibacteriaceae bacterium]|nr:short chain dehydrogenase [Propionibacteriaceae bacterium]